VKRLPLLVPSLQVRPETLAVPLADVPDDPQHAKGMSRWRALGRREFRALTATPLKKNRPEGSPVQDKDGRP
jgi:hypothetical protein